MIIIFDWCLKVFSFFIKIKDIKHTTIDGCRLAYVSSPNRIYCLQQSMTIQVT